MSFHPFMLGLVLGLQVLILVGLALGFRVLKRKVHLLGLGGRELSDQIFRQMEGLFAVYSVVGASSMLPRSRGWVASPDFLQVMIGIFRDHKPSIVLECSSGLSTLVAASLVRMRGDGFVYSLEHDSVYAEKLGA